VVTADPDDLLRELTFGEFLFAQVLFQNQFHTTAAECDSPSMRTLPPLRDCVFRRKKHPAR
jgi:hypothetical protein